MVSRLEGASRSPRPAAITRAGKEAFTASGNIIGPVILTARHLHLFQTSRKREGWARERRDERMREVDRRVREVDRRVREDEVQSGRKERT